MFIPIIMYSNFIFFSSSYIIHMSTKKKLVKVSVGYQLSLVTFSIMCQVEGINFIFGGKFWMKT